MPDPQHSEGELSGLSQAEAEARYVPGQDNSVTFKEGRSRRDIVREAVLSVYTYDLLGVAIVFWLLDRPISAIYSLAIMLLIFGFNITLAFKAKEKLDLLLAQTRPEASLMRSGELRAIDPNEIVPGDIVLVGPGDQFFADGRLLSDDPLKVNETWITGRLEARSLHEHDDVLAGSYCLSGHGVYEVEKVGDDRRVTTTLERLGAAEQPQTPLQAIVYLVLTGLRILALILGMYIVLRYTLLESDPGQRAVYENALSIILSLAPGGIYFMILLSYISGTSKLAGTGALVQRAETVETVAQTDVLCLGNAGTLTGAKVGFVALEEKGDEDTFSESRIQQILGDFARSTRSRSKLILAMRENFDGTKREVGEDALYLSLGGWQGIIFDDDDLQGVFVLGLESALDDHLDWTEIEYPGAAAANSETSQEAPTSHFLFAYSPELKPLHHRNGRPRLPERLMPLGYLIFSEVARPEARQTTTSFHEAGIAVKVLSSQKVEKVLESAVAAGITNPDGSPPDHASGLQLAGLSPEAFASTAAQVEVFGHLTPEQKGEIVRSLQEQDALAAMVGDSVADLSAQHEANLCVTFRDSSQAALSIADIILLDDTLNALPSILDTGQGIFNRLLDILRLTLTHALTAVLLTLIALVTGARYFPYLPAHNVAITVITITLPAAGLAFWLAPGRVKTKFLGRRLAFFILPAGISIAFLVLGAHILVQQWTSSVAYARIVVTHLLVGSGLLLVVFVQPPSPFWVGGDTLSGDRRPAMLAMVLWIIFIFLTFLPLAKRALALQTLRQPGHYLFVLALLAIWVLLLRALWRASWFRHLSGMSKIEEEILARR